MASSIFSTELTADTFARLLDWFHDDADQAAEMYEVMRFRLTSFFQARNCLYADDLVDTVFDRVAKKIGFEEIDRKSAYMLGVARNVYREYVRKEPFSNEVDEARFAATPAPDDSFEIEIVRTKLDACLDELRTNDRELVLEYMTGSGTEKINSHNAIKKRLGKSTNALRMKILRIKTRLRKCLEKCAA